MDRALTVLKSMLEQDGKTDIQQLSRQLDIPAATTYRLVAALERSGLIRRQPQSVFVPGPFLLRRFEPQRFYQYVAERSRPLVVDLSERFDSIAHLGVFENDMVTYLVKSTSDAGAVFTRESTQLDAYCSGLGKVLLAGLSESSLDDYFAGGELPRITVDTITDEQRLRRDIAAARKHGYALDNAEFEEGLYCIAAPVLDPDRRTVAAVSLSSRSRAHVGARRPKIVKALQATCARITEEIYGKR